MSELKLPRDLFIDEIYEVAKRNKSIYFLSADFGAKSLDKVRDELKDQFIFTGISEQAMINVAEGLSLNGNNPYCYAMDCFAATRSLEQLKVAAITMQLEKEKRNLNIIGVGPGFAYKDAGPTHYTTEIIGWLRGIAGIEILSPSDSLSIAEAARLSYTNPGLRYIRLEREALPDIYPNRDRLFAEQGIAEIRSGGDICLISTGYTTHKALSIREDLDKDGIKCGVVDMFRIKPFNEKAFIDITKGYTKVVTLEEHFVAGGIGELVASTLAKNRDFKQLQIIALKDQYYFENSAEHKKNREFLHKSGGIDKGTIVSLLR